VARDRGRVARGGGAAASRQFIEVGAETPGGVLLAVGLDISEIDPPTLAKTVTMIRQWRRLARGRHEFAPGGGDA
jgi:hypothetical protein